MCIVNGKVIVNSKTNTIPNGVAEDTVNAIGNVLAEILADTAISNAIG